MFTLKSSQRKHFTKGLRNMKKGMYNNRWYHICKAIVIINRGGGNIGNTALARDVGISRQAMNRVMIDAVKYGWVTVSEIEWRPNVMAKRYHPSKKGMQAVGRCEGFINRWESLKRLERKL